MSSLPMDRPFAAALSTGEVVCVIFDPSREDEFGEELFVSASGLPDEEAADDRVFCASELRRAGVGR